MIQRSFVSVCALVALLLSVNSVASQILVSRYLENQSRYFLDKISCVVIVSMNASELKCMRMKLVLVQPSIR